MRRGAEEIWIVWCLGDVPVYLGGPVRLYVQTLEMCAVGALHEDIARLAEINERIERGETVYGHTRPIRLHVIRPPQPLPLDTELYTGNITGRASTSWYLDETYMKVAGRWCYLYRAVDRDGQLIDSMLSAHRDKHAARQFLRRLIAVTEARPRRVTTDLHAAYPKAIRWIIGRKAEHRTTQYLNNYTEQSHRAVKQRYYPMLGFGSFESASRFCAAFEELRHYLAVRWRNQPQVPLSEQRRLFCARWDSLLHELAAA